MFYIYNFINKIKNNSKTEISSGYLIKYEFLNKIKKLELYQFVDKFIFNNVKIKNLLLNKKDDDFDEIFEKILDNLDDGIKYNINGDNKEINIYSNIYKVDFIRINLNKDIYKYIANNFIILNDEIYKLFSNNTNDLEQEKYNFFYEKNRLFVLLDKFKSKNTIDIFKMNYEGKFEYEFIINFIDQNIREENIGLIIQNGYDKYSEKYLCKKNDLVSFIFDQKQNFIGYNYKYISTIIDFSVYDFNLGIKKMFLIYLNYQKLRKKISNIFEDYYIINKNWIQNYKNYYNYDMISRVLDTNLICKRIIKYILDDNQNNKNYIIDDKTVFLMTNQIDDKIISDFNLKDKIFQFFKNTENIKPNDLNIIYKNMKFFYDFEIFNIEIYDYILKYINDNNLAQTKPEKLKCFIDKKYIIIKYPKTDLDIKYFIEIGELNDQNIFEIKFLLSYNKLEYLEEHIENIIKKIGIKDYCEKVKKSIKDIFYIRGTKNRIFGKGIKINMSQYSDKIDLFLDQNLASEINNKFIFNQLNRKNKDNQKQIPSVNNFFKNAPKVGLDNVGTNIFMNSILQCFCQIEEFASFFKYDKYVDKVINNYININKNCLTASFKILIDEIWPDQDTKTKSITSHFSPYEFQQKIGKMNPLFLGICANDPKDLVIFIIDTLNEELKQKSYKDDSDSNSMYSNNNDPIAVFQCFYEYYIRDCDSKICELFYAIQRIQTKCLKCNKIQYNWQCYSLLIFPLEEVRKYKIKQLNEDNLMSKNILNISYNKNILNKNIDYGIMNNNNMNMMYGNNMMINNNMMMNNNMNKFNINYNFTLHNFSQFLIPNIQRNFYIQNQLMVNKIDKNNMDNQDVKYIKMNKLNNNILDITDCFEYNQKTDLFRGRNQLYCNQCFDMADAACNTILETSPKILILIFNRGVKMQFNIKLEFSTELEISDYVFRRNGDEKIKYKLIGVITHLGENTKSGHFIAHCLSPIDKEWYTYNDSLVYKIQDIKKQIIDEGKPYLLFYKKME